MLTPYVGKIVFGRNRIIAALMPGMASAQAPDRHPAALNRAVFFQRLLGIMRAGRMKAALIADKGRQSIPIYMYNDYQRPAEYGYFIIVHRRLRHYTVF